MIKLQVTLPAPNKCVLIWRIMGTPLQCQTRKSCSPKKGVMAEEKGDDKKDNLQFYCYQHPMLSIKVFVLKKKSLESSATSNQKL